MDLFLQRNGFSKILRENQFYGVNCDKNAVSCAVLKPFERFEKELYFQVSETAKKVKLLLSLVLCLREREECFETAKEDQRAFMTQEATVRIK